MVDKIESLTPEQEAQLEPYREKWLQIGLCTDPIDFDKSVEAVKLMYECADLEAPPKFLYARSPIEAADMVVKESEGKISRDEALDSCVYGSQDAAWLSFYDFMLNVLKLKDIDNIRGIIEVAKTCGWVNCYDTVAIIQERPCAIKFDEADRLHSETGFALEYPDGFGVCSWHGTRVPDEWILDPDFLTAEGALNQDNVEQRRAACEIIGWDKVLDQLNARVINEDEDPEIGVLVEVDLPESGNDRFLKVMCGTGRTFAIPVPVETEDGKPIDTAKKANAWTYFLEDWELDDLELRT